MHGTTDYQKESWVIRRGWQRRTREAKKKSAARRAAEKSVRVEARKAGWEVTPSPTASEVAAAVAAARETRLRRIRAARRAHRRATTELLLADAYAIQYREATVADKSGRFVRGALENRRRTHYDAFEHRATPSLSSTEYIARRVKNRVNQQHGRKARASKNQVLSASPTDDSETGNSDGSNVGWGGGGGFGGGRRRTRAHLRGGEGSRDIGVKYEEDSDGSGSDGNGLPGNVSVSTPSTGVSPATPLFGGERYSDVADDYAQEDSHEDSAEDSENDVEEDSEEEESVDEIAEGETSSDLPSLVAFDGEDESDVFGHGSSNSDGEDTPSEVSEELEDLWWDDVGKVAQSYANSILKPDYVWPEDSIAAVAAMSNTVQPDDHDDEPAEQGADNPSEEILMDWIRRSKNPNELESNLTDAYHTSRTNTIASAPNTPDRPVPEPQRRFTPRLLNNLTTAPQSQEQGYRPYRPDDVHDTYFPGYVGPDIADMNVKLLRPVGRREEDSHNPNPRYWTLFDRADRQVPTARSKENRNDSPMTFEQTTSGSYNRLCRPRHIYHSRPWDNPPLPQVIDDADKMTCTTVTANQMQDTPEDGMDNRRVDEVITRNLDEPAGASRAHQRSGRPSRRHRTSRPPLATVDQLMRPEPPPVPTRNPTPKPTTTTTTTTTTGGNNTKTTSDDQGEKPQERGRESKSPTPVSRMPRIFDRRTPEQQKQHEEEVKRADEESKRRAQEQREKDEREAAEAAARGTPTPTPTSSRQGTPQLPTGPGRVPPENNPNKGGFIPAIPAGKQTVKPDLARVVQGPGRRPGTGGTTPGVTTPGLTPGLPMPRSPLSQVITTSNLSDTSEPDTTGQPNTQPPVQNQPVHDGGAAGSGGPAPPISPRTKALIEKFRKTVPPSYRTETDEWFRRYMIITGELPDPEAQSQRGSTSRPHSPRPQPESSTNPPQFPQPAVPQSRTRDPRNPVPLNPPNPLIGPAPDSFTDSVMELLRPALSEEDQGNDEKLVELIDELEKDLEKDDREELADLDDVESTGTPSTNFEPSSPMKRPASSTQPQPAKRARLDYSRPVNLVMARGELPTQTLEQLREHQRQTTSAIRTLLANGENEPLEILRLNRAYTMLQDEIGRRLAPPATGSSAGDTTSKTAVHFDLDLNEEYEDPAAATQSFLHGSSLRNGSNRSSGNIFGDRPDYAFEYPAPVPAGYFGPDIYSPSVATDADEDDGVGYYGDDAVNDALDHHRRRRAASFSPGMRKRAQRAIYSLDRTPWKPELEQYFAS